MIASSSSALPDPDAQAEFYADVPLKRAMAWVVDTLLILLLTALVVPFTAFTALFFLPVLYTALGFGYRVVTLARWSATPGMRLLSIEFRRHDGQTFDLLTAFLHTIGYTVSITAVLPQVVSAVLMLATARAQGLTDHVLGTVAINRASQRA